MKKHFTTAFLACFALFANAQNRNVVPLNSASSGPRPVDQEYSPQMYNPSLTARNGGNQTGVLSVSPLQLGSAANMYSSILQEQNYVAVNNDLGLVTFLHRNNPSIWGGSSGHLRYDVSVDAGASWNTDIGVMNPALSMVARYPQGAIYNPTGNTDPLNAFELYYSSVLNSAPDYDGHVNGVSTIVTVGGPVTTEHYQFQSTGAYLAGGLCESTSGTFWTVSPVLDANADYTGEIFLHKGVFAAGDVTWTVVDTLLPPHYIGFDGTKQMSNINIAFSPDGQTGWIAFLGDLVGGSDSTFHPVFFKSTDGGQTWGTPVEVNLNSVSWVADSLQTLWVDSLGNPVSTGLATCAFDFDLTVDANGNPHLAVVIGSAATSYSPLPTYVIFSALTKFMADVTTPNGGSTWDIKYLSPVLAFRGSIGSNVPLTWDNSPQVSRSADGNYILFSWTDSDTTVVGFGESNNIAPNLRICGLRIQDGYQTYPQLISDGDLIWDGNMYFPAMAPVSIGSGGTYNLAIVSERSTTTEPTDPTDFFYWGYECEICSPQYFNPSTMNLSWDFIRSFVQPSCSLGESDPVDTKQFTATLFPNPASDFVKINVRSSMSETTMIRVFNTTGELVLAPVSVGLSQGAATVQLDTRNLAQGIYFVNVTCGTEQVTEKLIIAE